MCRCADLCARLEFERRWGVWSQRPSASFLALLLPKRRPCHRLWLFAGRMAGAEQVALLPASP